MVRHTVLFKLKKSEDVDGAIKVLESMKGNVKEIIDIEVGKDFLHSERSFDIYLSVVLKDRKALEDYQNHPYHVNVVKKHMHQVRESSVALDFEF